MFDLILPKPTIKTRHTCAKREQEAIKAGLDPILAKVIAGRPFLSDLPILDALEPKLKSLFSPLAIKDMQLAAFRVAKAIQAGETIGIETDHDCDGQTSHAVLYYNLVERFHHPKEKIRSYIGHRLVEGYGLSASVAQRIIQDPVRPSLVITADNGSSDEPRIALLKQHDIDVIVTDHHEIPVEGYPKSAYACLNPTRLDCTYQDPYIAGCMVAWLLMAATRQILIKQHYLPIETPTLLDSLDFVAVGTVADCVSLARSINNRIVISYGLKLINQNKRACWQALRADHPEPLKSEDLAFRLGPLLNSDGRLDSAFQSVSLLLSESKAEALAWMDALKAQNTTRKKIQKDIVEQGIQIAARQAANGKFSLCIYLSDGHSGVHGIAASRIKDSFGRPCVFLAPKMLTPVQKALNPAQLNPYTDDDIIITGSVRGLEHFHVRDALQSISDLYPHLLIAFGGHKGAGGLTLSLRNLPQFELAFEAAAQFQLSSDHIGPTILTDGLLKKADLHLDLIDKLARLEPMGRELEAPIFEMDGYLKEIKAIGDGTHLRLVLEIEGKRFTAIWFSARRDVTDPLPFVLTHTQPGNLVKIIGSLKANTFRQQRTLDIQVIHMEAIDEIIGLKQAVHPICYAEII